MTRIDYEKINEVLDTIINYYKHKYFNIYEKYKNLPESELTEYMLKEYNDFAKKFDFIIELKLFIQECYCAYLENLDNRIRQNRIEIEEEQEEDFGRNLNQDN